MASAGRNLRFEGQDRGTALCVANLNSLIHLGVVVGVRLGGEIENLIRKGQLWEQKRNRAARLDGVAGVCTGGETGSPIARASSGSRSAADIKDLMDLKGAARLGGVAGVRPGRVANKNDSQGRALGAEA